MRAGNLWRLLCVWFLVPLLHVHGQSQSATPAPGTSDRQDPTTRAVVTAFAPGVIAIPTSANSAAPAFSPDGRIVYFGQSLQGVYSIMVARRSGDTWSAPQAAVFSGHFRDLEPAFAPNGKYLIYASNRPTTAHTALAEGNYNGQVLPGKGGYLWKVVRKKNGWSTPELLPFIINSNSSIFSPSIARDGSLYFMRADHGGYFHLYRSQGQHGHYAAPVQLSFSNQEKIGDYDPAVAPDESYIVFSSSRPPTLPHTADLFIAFRTPGGWGPPIDLRTHLSDQVYGVEARLSPDGKTLYFTRAATDDNRPPAAKIYRIWQVDISSVLKTKGAEAASAQAQ